MPEGGDPSRFGYSVAAAYTPDSGLNKVCVSAVPPHYPTRRERIRARACMAAVRVSRGRHGGGCEGREPVHGDREPARGAQRLVRDDALAAHDAARCRSHGACVLCWGRPLLRFVIVVVSAC